MYRRILQLAVVPGITAAAVLLIGAGCTTSKQQPDPDQLATTTVEDVSRPDVPGILPLDPQAAGWTVYENDEPALRFWHPAAYQAVELKVATTTSAALDDEAPALHVLLVPSGSAAVINVAVYDGQSPLYVRYNPFARRSETIDTDALKKQDERITVAEERLIGKWTGIWFERTGGERNFLFEQDGALYRFWTTAADLTMFKGIIEQATVPEQQ